MEPLECAHTPPGTMHTFSNPGGERVRFLSRQSPGGFDIKMAGQMGGAIVSRPGEGELFTRDDRSLLVRLDLPELSAIEIEFEPSFRVEQHTHGDHVDSFLVLDGQVEFLLEDGPVTVGPGTLVAAPPGTLHGFANPGPGRARILNFHAPDAGFVGFVRGG